MKGRLVVKIGSNVLARDDGNLDLTRMSAIADDIAALRNIGYEVILVSSGAITSGKGEMRASHRLGSVEQRQLYSAVGQTKLMGIYYGLFREYGIHVGQVLTMKECFSTRHEYLNQRACMSVMLDNGVLPIVNENDTVSVTELMFTDNDELSGLIAAMMDADTLIILTNVDGIYDGKPGQRGAKVIAKVTADDDITQCISEEKSGFGRGGMITKYNIARKVADEGIQVFIANGKRDGVLTALMTRPDETVHTEFVPNPSPASNIKKWIAHSESFAKGVVRVNDKAAQALCGDRAVSVLLVGVTAIDGEFEEGDIVDIVDGHGTKLAVGRSAYSSDDARKHIGEHGIRPIVHYDYLYIE